jgi:hypothetical protein
VETWASSAIVDSELMLDGYGMYRVDRQEGKGGGIILYVKETLRSSLCSVLTNFGFAKSVWCVVELRTVKLLVGVCYRNPTSSPENNAKLNELITLATKQNGINHIMILGDFNYPDIDYEEYTTQWWRDPIQQLVHFSEKHRTFFSIRACMKRHV